MFLFVLACSSELKSEISSLKSQLDKANLAKSVAESKLSDFDRYKSMIELEITELLARHKTVMTERVARTAQVGGCGLKWVVGVASTGWVNLLLAEGFFSDSKKGGIVR